MAKLSTELQELYENLLVSVLREQLPGSPVNENEPSSHQLTEMQVTRLIGVASALALEEDSTSQSMAYEIITQTLSHFGEELPNLAAVCANLLSRLGNFPARKLLESRYDVNGTFGSIFLQLEAITRTIENTVEVAGADIELTDFQTSLYETLQQSPFSSVSAPTSAGKSFILALSLVKWLLRGGPQTIILVVPTRALIRQTVALILRQLKSAGLSEIPVRSVPIPISRSEAPNGAVYILTQERLLSYLFSDEGEPRVSSLIIDEAQGVSDGARGVLLHTAISTVREQFPDADIHFASPLAKNPKFLLSLFELEDGSRTLLETNSPVSQNIIIVRTEPRKPRKPIFELQMNGGILSLGHNKIDYSLKGNAFERRALFAKSVTRRDECTIVYANGAANAEKIARHIIADKQQAESVDQEILDFIKFLREHIHPDYELAEMLKYSTAFHYGNLPTIVRSKLEDLFSEGKLTYICCTSTLLQGVNLPAKHIILESPSKGWGKPMDRAAFLNLAGRAGRLMKEFHGNIWCLNPSDWDKPSGEDTVCFEGDSHHVIEDSFSNTLADGGTLLRKSLNEDDFKDPNQEELGATALSKVFSDYIQAGIPLDQSRFADDHNRAGLEETMEACKSIRLDLPRNVIAQNAGVHPIRLQRLYEYFGGQIALDEYVPLTPHESGSYSNMELIFHVSDKYLSAIDNESYKFHAWLASQWIHDTPLKRMIQERVDYMKERGKSPEVGKIIREIIKALEYDIRYRFVKHTRAYNDVLGLVLRKRGRDDLASRIIPLHLFLECGASNSTVLSLLSLGLSRTTALLLKGKITFSDHPTPEQCRATLRAKNLNELEIPSICKTELEQII